MIYLEVLKTNLWSELLSDKCLQTKIAEVQIYKVCTRDTSKLCIKRSSVQKTRKKYSVFFSKKNKIISRMLPSTFLVKSIFRKRAMKINPRKAKATSPRILFFEIFAPQISKNILENLKIFPHKSFTFKLYATNIRKSKKCPK